MPCALRQGTKTWLPDVTDRIGIRASSITSGCFSSLGTLALRSALMHVRSTGIWS